MKLARHSQIIRLINEYDIETQEELAEKLNESGFRVTQATVSRDIPGAEADEDRHPRRPFPVRCFQNPDRELASRYIHVLKTAFVSMDTAQNLLVIKTVSGMAMAAAAALDDMNWSEIVGCIAGDNTIMCAARNSDEALLAMAKLKKMLEEDSGS